MNPNKNNNDLELEKMASEFADNFVKEGNYPEKVSDIEVKLYFIPGRDVL